MTSRECVFGAICEILRKDLRCTEPITPETDLHADAQLDSVDLLTLTVELENRFEIMLDEVEGPEAIRVDRLVDHVLRQLGGVTGEAPVTVGVPGNE